MTEAQKCLHHIAENMRMDKSISKEGYEYFQQAIKALEQEPKTGHWIANAPQYDMLNPQYICSECGNAHTRITPYCEMCGAKMGEPQESEDEE